MQDLAGSSRISPELRVRGGSFSLGGHLPPHPTLFTVLASYACCLPLYYSIYMYDQASYCDMRHNICNFVLKYYCCIFIRVYSLGIYNPPLSSRRSHLAPLI